MLEKRIQKVTAVPELSGVMVERKQKRNPKTVNTGEIQK
jgi:hypothetical protein